MLDPKTPIALLPQDREIMDILGLTEAEYRAFCLECQRRSTFRPGEPLAFEPVTFAVTLLVGIALSAISALLAPKQQEPEEANYEESTVDGQDIVRKDRFAPKSGFDSVQNVVNLGSVIPIVYAKRETISGNQYGGIRINTNLLWSQLMSIGGGQFFRGIFMVGEATNVDGVAEGPIIDFDQTALGNNTLASYYLSENQTAGRATLYYSPDSGRITNGNYELGVIAQNDIGNKSRDSLPEAERGPDVYSIESASEQPDRSFCQAVIPSNQTQFGLYGLCGNRFGYKLGERFEAVTQWQNRSDGEYERQDSNQKVAQNKKDRAMFSTRAGFMAEGDQTDGELIRLERGDTIRYRIYRSSDKDQIFESDNSSSGGEEKSEVKTEDVASTISSLQRGYDERINVGDIYKAGSALVICSERSEQPFQSEADGDGDGTQVTHTFECLDEGDVHVWDSDTLQRGPYYTDTDYENPERRALNATESSHLLQMSIGSFALERSARTIEIGFKSVLGIKSSGIANFNSLVVPPEYDGYPNYQEYVDAEFCGGQEDGDSAEDESYRKEILAGKYTSADDRYSFFKIQYRDVDREFFTTINECFGIRSQTSEAVYNYIRIRFPDSKRREFRFLPLSGWEIRNSEQMGSGALMLLDPHVATKVTRTSGDVELVFNGIENLSRSAAVLGINAFANLNTGLSDSINTGSLTVQTAGNYDTDPRLQDYGNVSLVEASPGSANGRNAKCRITTNDSGNITSFAVTNSGTGYQVGDTLTLSRNDLPEESPLNPFQDQVWRVDSIRSTPRQQIGYAPEDDTSYYVDRFARVAEAFTYADISNTATQPEHQISYVNIIDENEQRANYDGMAIVGLNIRSTREISRLDQLSVYVQRGVIDSHLFPDVFEDLLTNPVYGVGGFFNVDQIDEPSFLAAAEWTQSRRYFFDGAITNKINLRTWGSERAADFLLDLAISGGKFRLQPVANFGGQEEVVALFTSGNIIEDTFEMSFFDVQDRIPPRVSVKWREERASLTVNDNGLFPRIREVKVAYRDTPADAPEQTIDMSNFCTNEQHAIDRAKWAILQKLFITNAVKFSTIPTQAGIQVGSVIKMGVETRRYEQPKNGLIDGEGRIITYPSIGSGDFPVILWDGETYRETTIRSNGGKSPNQRNCVFCLRDVENVAQPYKVQKVSFNEDGNLDVEAVYWPIGDDGVSSLVTNFADANFDIER